jgi:hypothetical protein
LTHSLRGNAYRVAFSRSASVVDLSATQSE